MNDAAIMAARVLNRVLSNFERLSVAVNVGARPTTNWRCNSAKAPSRRISKKTSGPRSVFTHRVVLGVSKTGGDTPCPTSPSF
jgi:hypothetical protein